MAFRIILESETPIRVLSSQPEPPPAPPEPPPGPPDPPENHDPFVWPPQPPPVDYAEQRYASPGQGFYLGEPRFQNPLPGSHLFAGFVQDVRAKVGYWDVWGYRVWAPRDADPALIRRVIRTGHVV